MEWYCLAQKMFYKITKDFSIVQKWWHERFYGRATAILLSMNFEGFPSQCEKGLRRESSWNPYGKLITSLPHLYRLLCSVGKHVGLREFYLVY